jgi:hypothetical protein
MRTSQFLRRFSLLFFCILIASGAQEKAKLSGTVRDQQGAVISGVEIIITPDCKCSDCKDPKKCECCPDQMQVTTNSDGEFHVNVPAGTYTLQAKGFKGSVTVTVHSGENKNASMTVSPD